jgi:hypothetical protein
MAEVGRFVTDPKAGAYCRITLDSGEKILVHHAGSGFKDGRVTIDVLKFLGFGSDRIFTCDLNSPEGRAALNHLTRDARQGSVEATALGAFVAHVRSCKSLAEVKTGCAALMSIP